MRKIMPEIKENLRPSCEDCISRKEALEIFGDAHPMDYNTKSYMTQIEDLPSVTPRKVAGRWIEVNDFVTYQEKNVKYRCSICGNEDSDFGEYNYCPICGAEMER